MGNFLQVLGPQLLSELSKTLDLREPATIWHVPGKSDKFNPGSPGTSQVFPTQYIITNIHSGVTNSLQRILGLLCPLSCSSPPTSPASPIFKAYCTLSTIRSIAIALISATITSYWTMQKLWTLSPLAFLPPKSFSSLFNYLSLFK